MLHVISMYLSHWKMFDVFLLRSLGGPLHPTPNAVLLVLSFQDSSSVIQFVTRARVQVDPDLRVVEVPNGSPEEKPVSK